MSLQITTTGAGRDLALIHGWGLGAGVWDAVIEGLAARCRVHRVSLAGYDGTAPDALDFSATAMVIADALPSGVTLCGWSLGGMLALEAARCRPQAISRLILVATSPRFLAAPDWPHAQPAAVLESFRAELAKDVRATLSRFILLFNQGDAKVRMIARVFVRELEALRDADLPDSATLRRGLDWLGEVDMRSHLSALHLPALVIHGERDPLMDSASGRYLADHLPEAQHFAPYPGTAHAPFVADPDRFVRDVLAFRHMPCEA